MYRYFHWCLSHNCFCFSSEFDDFQLHAQTRVYGDFIFVKFDLLAVIYGIAFLFIGVYLTIVFYFHRSSMP